MHRRVSVVVYGGRGVGRTTLVDAMCGGVKRTKSAGSGVRVVHLSQEAYGGDSSLNVVVVEGGEGASPEAVSIEDGGVGIAMLVYDVRQRVSFLEALAQYRSAVLLTWPSAVVMLVGTHADGWDAREVRVEEAAGVAEENGMYFFEVDGSHVPRGPDDPDDNVALLLEAIKLLAEEHCLAETLPVFVRETELDLASGDTPPASFSSVSALPVEVAFRTAPQCVSLLCDVQDGSSVGQASGRLVVDRRVPVVRPEPELQDRVVAARSSIVFADDVYARFLQPVVPTPTSTPTPSTQPVPGTTGAARMVSSIKGREEVGVGASTMLPVLSTPAPSLRGAPRPMPGPTPVSRHSMGGRTPAPVTPMTPMRMTPVRQRGSLRASLASVLEEAAEAAEAAEAEAAAKAEKEAEAALMADLRRTKEKARVLAQERAAAAVAQDALRLEDLSSSQATPPDQSRHRWRRPAVLEQPETPPEQPKQMETITYTLDPEAREFIKDTATPLPRERRNTSSNPRLVVRVEVGDGREEDLIIHAEDDTVDAARAFVRKHALPRAFINPLAQHLAVKVESHLKKALAATRGAAGAATRGAATTAHPPLCVLDVDIGAGTTLPLPVYQGMDPWRSAMEFSTKHKLGAGAERKVGCLIAKVLQAGGATAS